MKMIGLTGGIGSGKSTVSAYLAEKGMYIFDCDKVSRGLTAPDGPALPAIREIFGDDVFFEDGTLDRKTLAAIVFNDRECLKALEEITTELVVDMSFEAYETLEAEGKTDFMVIDAPLLFESYDTVNDERFFETWLVTCDLDERLRRVAMRDGMTRQDILQRMKNQMTEEEKLRLADKVIDNSGTREETYKQVDRLLDELMNL